MHAETNPKCINRNGGEIIEELGIRDEEALG